MKTNPKLRFIGNVAAWVLLGAVLSGPAFAAGGHGRDNNGGHDKSFAAHGEKMSGENGGHMMGGRGNDGHGVGPALSFGEAGKPDKVDRTVEVIMTDLEYNISELTVKAGETVRFVLKNQGEFLHEFNIGMPAMHAAHQQDMIMMMETGMMTATKMVEMSQSEHMKHGMSMPMAHDDPNAMIVEPGQTAELIWRFKEASELQFACNIPGHYESGMVGEIRFESH